ncbi:MAG: PBP1A family penicillin-binding protein [Spirochaetia bacterium]|jgi:penicillin-binding protein 1A|nr:PBP1A family penicillin-binding protein [Spirochaetia bacterium]
MEQKLFKIEKAALIALTVFAVLGGFISGYINAEIKNFSGIENLKRFQPSVPTRLYDVNGELITELYQEKRNIVTLEDIPVSLINAFIASEDGEFYSHFGINPLAIARAMVKNVTASVKAGKPRVVQGGSTITQQLAKRIFTDSERTVTRKIHEAVLAFQIEKRFSKEEILEMYFNQIDLGHGCYGISTAAGFFFNKDVKHLSVIESSVLAALPSRPSGYSPLREPKAAVEKNRDTLRRMVDAGYLSREDADKMYNEFWPKFIASLKDEFPTKNVSSARNDAAPFFVDYVRQILVSRFGKDAVYNDGLSVYTTLDLKRQLVAQKYMEQGIARQNIVSNRANAMYNSALDRSLFSAYNYLKMIFGLPSPIVHNDVETVFRKQMADDLVDSIDVLSIFTDAGEVNHSVQTFRELISGISTSLSVQGALIAIEPKTGYITSMIGGSEYSVNNQYNRAVQARRQPGSSFKPFVYGSAIEAKSISPATQLLDAPILDIDASGETWSPGNYEGNYSGMVAVRRALAASINVISVRIYDIVGAGTIIDYAAKMTKAQASRFNSSPSLALGTTELTPFEMATGYAIYANDGRDVIPFAIRYVEDRDGNELANVEEEVGMIIALKEINGSIQVISKEVDYVMTSLMQSVVDAGTASESIRLRAGFRKKAAGKTGTTQNWTDAWFCGFTPDIAAVVWLGYDRSFMSLGKHQAGASVAAPIWAGYMRDIYNIGMPEESFSPQPEGVIHAGGDIMIRGSRIGGYGEGGGQRVKSVLDRYLEKEGLQ